mmetsp:Transcript_69415/g.199100  ORF Transcript_69415/g.199100 Transcript_69415/m.199100 type:complete len:95 (+) Transcript_69415:1486-1770(+)
MAGRSTASTRASPLRNQVVSLTSIRTEPTNGLMVVVLVAMIVGPLALLVVLVVVVEGTPVSAAPAEGKPNDVKVAVAVEDAAVDVNVTVDDDGV